MVLFMIISLYVSYISLFHGPFHDYLSICFVSLHFFANNFPLSCITTICNIIIVLLLIPSLNLVILQIFEMQNYCISYAFFLLECNEFKEGIICNINNII